MTKTDIAAIQDTVEAINMILTDTETQLTKIVDNMQDAENDIFHYACHVRHAIVRAKQAFQSTLYRYRRMGDKKYGQTGKQTDRGQAN